MATIKDGDGRPLKPYRGWHALWRTLFLIDLVDPEDPDGEPERFAVDVDYVVFEDAAALYRDDRQVARSSLPVSFPVPGGVIEVASTLYGLRRMHYVREDGTQQQLRPHRGTPEELRARLGRRFPRLSRVIAGVAVAVLLVALALTVPQLLERISEIEWVAEHVGTFTSPIALPAWLNGALVAAGVLAALERALTLRNHWLIDADTFLLGD
ncbi:MAG: hypothetical protein BGO96_15415 [Micrococcales bacterium 73-15]|uniref:hypothetical protein n=1 Tax=Salana multivorans TaxID=120377 RepID=UPI00095D3D4C|nr:hypothetical protein [Salana multivorans]OJX94295.1 MAG: hypothetical protein BGO96_15415 [Micrococcales bacterium 73-15]